MERFNKKIGYVGLGSMGGAIARRLEASGFDLTVYDIRAEAIDSFKDTGIKTVDSVGELVKACDVIMVCVERNSQLCEVVNGSNGILDNARQDQMIVVQSTVKIATVEKLAQAAAEKGVSLIDAPVSGNMEDRQNGTLAVYVGSDEQSVESIVPVFNAIGAEGKKVVYMGKLGNGELAALCNSITDTVMVSCTWQAMQLARLYDVKDDKVIKVADIGVAKGYATDNWPYADELLKSHRLGPCMCRIVRENLMDAVEAGREKGVGMPLTTLTASMLENIYFERASYLEKRDGFEYSHNTSIEQG